MRSRWTAVAIAATTLSTAVLSACGDDAGGALTTGLSTTTIAVDAAATAFCGDLADSIAVVDTYGRVFTEDRTTVGDVQSEAAALDAAQTALQESSDDLEAALASAASTSVAGATTTALLTAKTAQEHLDAITSATSALDEAIGATDPSTTLADAAIEVQAAAFGLEQAYVSLFLDAGCLEGNAQAASAVAAYTTGLQQDLAALEVYTGPIDGIYGPLTVAAVKEVQAAAGLPETGVVDPKTEAALAKQLGDKGTQEAASVLALQSALTTTGFYSGPIDGVPSPELDEAVIAYQAANGLEQTGTVDPATLASLLSGTATNATNATTTTLPPATTAAAATTAAPATTAIASTTSGS